MLNFHILFSILFFLQVSSFCTAALTAVEKLVHPASGTLNFPVSLEEMLESTKRYRQEYPTKTKESNTSVETSEEEEVTNYVHKREGSGRSEQSTSHTYHSSNSSEEVVLVYENKMEVDDDETDESEEEEIPECEVVSLDSEESDSSVKNKASEPYGLSKVFGKTHDEQAVSLVGTGESDEEFQHKEVGSASFVDISDENGSCSNVGDFKKGMSQNYNSKTDNKTQSATLIRINKEPPSITSTKSKNKIGTSRDLSNEDKLISNQQQKGTMESRTDASNRCENIIYASTEKGSKEITGSTEICTSKRTLFVTENEEEKEDNDFVLLVVQEDDDNEPNPKKVKLDSPESAKKYKKPNAETAKTDSHSDVKDSAAVPITGNYEEQAVNGVAVDPKDVAEEEMLQAFVDVLSD
jgi:hypothetical protein